MNHPGTLRIWILVLVVATCTLLSAQAPDPPRFVEVYVAGERGYHTYRIPSLIATSSGVLLAFAEARKAGASDAGDIDLVLKRSHDGGITWSALQVVGDNGPHTFGNPCPVIDRRTGTIWLLATQNLGTDREKDIIAGTSAGSRTVWILKSEDDGSTWSTPVEITERVKRRDWTWYATGPGVGIQTRSGRLVIPANHAESGTGIHRSHIVFSDDGGRSWTLGASSDAGTNESQIVELTDGRLMMNMRNHPPKPENFRMVAISADLGRTLSRASPDPALIEPPAQASLIAFPSDGTHDRPRLLFANPASSRRERLTVRVSDDDGATWPVSRVLHEGPAAYSSLVALPDDSVGILFERGTSSAYETITFARFSLDWLTGGKKSASRGGLTVTSLPPVPDAHGVAGAFAGVHRGWLLAAGGANFPKGPPWSGGPKVWHDRVVALDLQVPDATWREVGRLPAPNGYGVSLTAPEGVFVIGGGNADRHFAAVGLMTLQNGNVFFRTLPALPEPAAQMAGALAGRTVHVVGGIDRPDATSASPRHYVLDLDDVSHGWKAMARLPGPGRILPVAAAIGDAFYVFGGCALSADAEGKPVRTYLRDAWRFFGGEWKRVADLPRAATAAASPAPVSGHDAFVVSGDDGTEVRRASPADHPGFPSGILRYDAEANVWHVAGRLDGPAPVTLPAAPWRDGFVLYSGEIRPGVRTPQVLLYRPAR